MLLSFSAEGPRGGPRGPGGPRGLKDPGPRGMGLKHPGLKDIGLKDLGPRGMGLKDPGLKDPGPRGKI